MTWPSKRPASEAQLKGRPVSAASSDCFVDLEPRFTAQRSPWPAPLKLEGRQPTSLITRSDTASVNSGLLQKRTAWRLGQSRGHHTQD